MTKRQGITMNLYLFVLALAILSPLGYIYSETGRQFYTLLPYFSAPSIQVSNLSSMLEVAVGINLAVSVWDAFSDSISKSLDDWVQKRNPIKNPTFLEALKEVAKSHEDQTGTPVNTELFMDKYERSINQHMDAFRKAISVSTKKLKNMALISSLASFFMLVGIAKSTNLDIPPIIFWAVVFAISAPLLTHLIVASFHYIDYSTKIQCLDEKNGAAHFNAITRETFKAYERLEKEASRSASKIT